jgi:hypothetical protein
VHDGTVWEEKEKDMLTIRQVILYAGGSTIAVEGSNRSDRKWLGLGVSQLKEYLDRLQDDLPRALMPNGDRLGAEQGSKARRIIHEGLDSARDSMNEAGHAFAITLRSHSRVWDEKGEIISRDHVQVGGRIKEEWSMTPGEIYCLYDDVQRIVTAGRMGDEKALLRKQMIQYSPLKETIDNNKLEAPEGRSRWIIEDRKTVGIFPLIAHAMEIIIYGRKGVAGCSQSNGHIAPMYRDHLEPVQTKWVINEWRELIRLSEMTRPLQSNQSAEEELKGESRSREWIAIPFRKAEGLLNTEELMKYQWEAVKYELIRMLFEEGDSNL